MSSVQSAPISEILKTRSGKTDEQSVNDDDGLGGEPKKKTREDWKKAKELEEARKAGTAPAAVDEEGKDINPHIPQYISTTPWYFGSTGPTLKHQRPQPEKQHRFATIHDGVQRGVNLSSTATKYRKGACENCGSMTHKKKDCVERPRKIGAKYTGAHIAPDEIVQSNNNNGHLQYDYDGKRDRWKGYDIEEHNTILEDFQKLEEAKRILKAENLKSSSVGMSQAEDGEEKDADADEDDEDKYADAIDMPGTKVDSKQRITVRNLRIREDTAKYLRNLDPDSAYYDPKTRSMRENPYKNTGKHQHEIDYAGENLVRYCGDTLKQANAQLFSWEAHEKGVDVHILAEPTKLEVLQREYETKKDEFKSNIKDSLLEKYGGSEHLNAPSKLLLLAQTEDYVEYSRHGKIIKGKEKSMLPSRYEEDVYINNHTSVWGSFWKDGCWGYKCCYSFIKSSYCVGETGRRLALEGGEGEDEEGHVGEADGREGAAKPAAAGEGERGKTTAETVAQPPSPPVRVWKHLQKANESEGGGGGSKNRNSLSRVSSSLVDDRKRKYSSNAEVKEPTEEEMDEYYRRKARSDDPMLMGVSGYKIG